MAEPERTIALPEVTVRLRADGIIEYDYHLHGQVDLETARRAVAAGRQFTMAARPALVRFTGVTGLTREARRYLADGADFRAVASQVALVATTPLAQTLGRFLIGSGDAFRRLPMRSFPGDDEAVGWLLGKRDLPQTEAVAGPQDGAPPRHEAIVDLLFALSRHDFNRRAPVSDTGGGLDAVASAANMLSEELEVALLSKDEHSRAVEESASAQSQFMANMSHEIRTPLTALLGFADLLMDTSLGEADRRNYAQIIKRNGEHLLALINDILDLSKIEAGKLTLETLDCDLLALLQDVESLMRVRATERAIGFAVDLTTPIPATILTDPTRLRQVLLNLVGNAIKFTEFGSVRLVVRWDDRQAPGRLIFDVVDTGIGMTPEQVERLFQPFEQADSSMTRRFGGSGLGLSISKPLAEALGGHLSVQSVQGRGSTFTLSLNPTVPPDTPLVGGAPVAPVATAQEPAAAPERLSGTVLLAEDGLDNQLLVSTILRHRGLTVELAENGQVAVEMALSAWRDGRPFGVILMDMQMPLLDGYGATMSLREMGYRGPIIALTAHAMAGERERCFAAGCNGYLSKPIDRPTLMAHLARHLAPAEEETVAGPDEAPLISSYADDPDMADLIQRFVQNLPHRIAEIRTAASRQEPEALMHIAHQLKGAAGGYGFAPISEAAARLEQGLRGANMHQAPALVAELVALCTRASAPATGASQT